MSELPFHYQDFHNFEGNAQATFPTLEAEAVETLRTLASGDEPNTVFGVLYEDEDPKDAIEIATILGCPTEKAQEVLDMLVESGLTVPIAENGLDKFMLPLYKSSYLELLQLREMARRATQKTYLQRALGKISRVFLNYPTE